MAEVEYSSQGWVRFITFNRPETLNALTFEGEGLFANYLQEFQEDADARVLVISGTDKAFSTGLDLKSRGLNNSASKPARTLTSREPIKVTKPIIAAIAGYALGGGLEIALAADIRVVADNARLGLPEVRRGLIPGAGGIQRLARLVPLGNAYQMLFSGEWITAEEAYRIGLVQRVTRVEELLSVATELAEKIAANAPLAVQATKEAVSHGLGLRLDDALDYDNLLVFRNRQSEDSKEGVRAFLEKREPNFLGR